MGLRRVECLPRHKHIPAFVARFSPCRYIAEWLAEELRKLWPGFEVVSPAAERQRQVQET